MSKLFRACVLLLILGSCGARDGSAPRNLDNACSILTERPHYVRAFKQAERNWGVETHVLMAM
ncbi:MAG: lytic transglycosylase, partial [Octadecabacter sp.]